MHVSILTISLAALPALGQPTVSLLTDFAGYATSGSVNLRSVLNQVSSRKGSQFYFGSTYDTSLGDQSWMATAFTNTFNHLVAENGCKWSATETSRGTSTLTQCLGAQSFATSHNCTFRGHNTFWHSQLPSWLPGSVTCSDLTTNVIPQHVQQEISGMGSSVVSWDVVNEIVGDGVSSGNTAFQCVSNKNDWPTKTSDGSGTNLCTDMTFVHAAFTNALSSAASSTRLMINDYNTGGNDAKTACMFTVLADIVAAGVPYNRLGVGFQTHVTASSGGFYAKADLVANLAKLASLGATGALTEIDIALPSNTTAYQRYQAAIWGDYLDACLYASNCHEFINWDPRDDLSWLGTSKAGTLFDSNGNPKLVTYEIQARLTRYANGEAELCATALGSGSCTASGPGNTTTTTSSSTTTSSTTTTSTTTSAGCTQTHWGQCGGISYTGCTTCASGYTCTYSNAYYSQCL